MKFVVLKLNWNMLQLTMIIGLTHWGGVTHICVGNLTIISSDNELSPGQRQAIIWTNAGIVLTGTNFREILIEIQTYWLKKIRFPFRLDLDVLENSMVQRWRHMLSSLVQVTAWCLACCLEYAPKFKYIYIYIYIYVGGGGGGCLYVCVSVCYINDVRHRCVEEKYNNGENDVGG